MVTGIIAEYNPFHNGHKYQIDYAKNTLKSDFIVVALSPDFTQRGEIAILSKYERTKIALNLGIDLVIQLPVNCATDSSSGYAYGGVKLLDSLGIIDNLLFSAEDNDINLLNVISELEIDKHDDYLDLVNVYLKSGYNYPVAREKTIMSLIDDDNLLSLDNSSIHNALSKPNNILAIEYLKAIKLTGSSIKPVCIKRIGSDYNDTKININNEINNNSEINNDLDTNNDFDINIDICSATAIRNAISNNNFKVIKDVVPKYAFSIYKNAYDNNRFLSPEDVSLMLGYKLIQFDLCDGNTVGFDLKHIHDCSESLRNKIFGEINNYTTYSAFANLLKSKDITHTRISRVLCHILLDITEDLYFKKDGDIYPIIPYIFVLGINENGLSLMGDIKKKCTLPYFTSINDALDFSFENVNAKDVLLADIGATQIANMILANKTSSKVISEKSRKFMRI
ncbi:MAG: nucleotidyltransferase family protein [Lachnospiraceae bacterium]|nr:nucleotidyltransferase family protein [Lachnospiraceae bacterium]